MSGVRTISRGDVGARKRRIWSAEQKKALSEHNARLDEMLEFFQTLERLGQRFVSPAGRGLQVAATLLNRVHEMVTPDDRGARP